MSQVIRISEELYKRLENHANGFDTPSNVIERVLNLYEGVTDASSDTKPNPEKAPASDLEIIYFADSEEDFKKQLISKKKAYIKLHYTNGVTETKSWNAKRFSPKSRVDGNLRSGYLRGWKDRGIFRAELSVNHEDVA